MSESAQTPPDAVPEADWAEQEVDADPVTEDLGEPGERPADLNRGIREVDEADLAEQETVAYTDDEE